MTLHQGSGGIIKGSDDGNGHQLIITARHVVMGLMVDQPISGRFFSITSWEGIPLGMAAIAGCDRIDPPAEGSIHDSVSQIAPGTLYHDACILKMIQPNSSYDELPGYQLDMLADGEGETHAGPLLLCEDGKYGDPGWGHGMSGGPLINMEDPDNPKMVGVISGISIFNETGDNCAYFAPVTRSMWSAVFNDSHYRGIRRLSVPSKWRLEGFLHGQPTGISTSSGIVNMQIIEEP